MDSISHIALASMAESFLLVKLGYPIVDAVAGRYTVPFLLFFVAQLFAKAVYWILIYPNFISPLRDLPQPSGGSWINGQGAKIVREESGKPQLEWCRDIPNDGLLYYRGLFNRERLIPTNAKTIAEVLTTKSYIFIKPAQLQASIGRLLGVGVLLAEGDEHKRQRKILTPAFAPRHLRTLIPLFWGKSQKLAEQITNFVESAEVANPVVDYNAWSSRCALDIIGQAGFGVEFDALTKPDSKYVQTYRTVFQPSRAAMVLGILNQFLPGWLVTMIPMKRNEDINRASSIIANLCLDQVKDKKTALSEKKTLAPDILSIMIEEGSFNDEEMKNQLMTFMAAGHETTASSLTWCMYALARHPEMQTRLRNEIRATIPSLNTALATPEVIDSIRYLRNFCNEILRFYPPVPITLREASQDTTIGERFVPKGTTVLLAPAAVNKSKQFWGEDAEEFNPDRWDREGGAGGATTNYALLTFLMGPRSCIGQKFAVEEFKCMTAALAGRFSFEEKEKDMPIVVKGGITARPQHGMPLKTTIVPGW